MATSTALDQVTIPVPCHVAWEAMAGTGRVRFCPSCRQNVYNVAEMTREAAEALIRRPGRPPCVRLFRRPDGTVLTRDCREPLRAMRRAVAAGVVLAATFLLALLAWLGLRTGAAGGRGDNAFNVRQIEPLRSLLEWINPSPPVVMGTPPPTPIAPGGGGPKPPECPDAEPPQE